MAKYQIDYKRNTPYRNVKTQVLSAHLLLSLILCSNRIVRDLLMIRVVRGSMHVKIDQ